MGRGGLRAVHGVLDPPTPRHPREERLNGIDSGLGRSACTNSAGRIGFPRDWGRGGSDAAADRCRNLHARRTDRESYRATERVREVFGEEPVVVVAEGDLQELILTPYLGRLLRWRGLPLRQGAERGDPDSGALRGTGTSWTRCSSSPGRHLPQ